MKLKRLVEDFRVEEQVADLATGGPFALYRLTKQSLGTPEAIDAVLKRWNLPRSEVAYAGLKDKHALTTQYVTIQGGPQRGLSQTNLELEYVGQAARPIHASDITANRFNIVLRDLTPLEQGSARKALETIAHNGLPNYFDNQRFGSVGVSGEFIAKPWCLGDYERAVWLAIAEGNVHDSPREREDKRQLQEHWGDWKKCKELLQGSRHFNIVSHLANRPGDFRCAVALLRQDLRSLWLAAFQSRLWNQILASLLRQICQPEQLVGQSIAQRELPFFTHLDETQRQRLAAITLPLPSARLHLEEGSLKELYGQALVAEGLELRQVRVKYPRDSFFSKGERAAIFRAGDLTHSSASDELYSGRQKLMLGFTLTRGSYATILVKCVTGAADADVDLTADS